MEKSKIKRVKDEIIPVLEVMTRKGLWYQLSMLFTLWARRVRQYNSREFELPYIGRVRTYSSVKEKREIFPKIMSWGLRLTNKILLWIAVQLSGQRKQEKAAAKLKTLIGPSLLKVATGGSRYKLSSEYIAVHEKRLQERVERLSKETPFKIPERAHEPEVSVVEAQGGSGEG